MLLLKKVPLNVSVVGGGVSGLVASIYFARAGHKVTLFEKNYSCGGLVNSFERDGFLFDGGVPALLNSGIIKPMLKEIDVNLEFLENKVSIGIENEIMNVNGRDSFYEYGKMLKRLYPEIQNEVDRFINIIEKIVSNVEILYSVDNPLFVDMQEMKKNISKYLEWLVKLPSVLISMKRLKMSVYDYVLQILKNISATDIVTQHFFKDTPTFFALSYFYIYNDYIYPKGGVGKLAKALENKAKDLGVKIFYNTEIHKVDVSEHTLFDKDGNKYIYDKMVWSSDLKKLYKILEDQNVNTRKWNIDKERKRVLQGKPAESVFKVFLAVDKSPNYFKSISEAHFFYTPSKFGIGIIDKEELEKIKLEMNKKEILNWLDRYCERVSYEISIPTLRDHSLAPEGKTGIIVNFFFDYELTKKIYEMGWYDDFKNEVEDRIVEILDKSVYRGIKERILLKFSSTPLTIARLAGTTHGSIVGWAFGQPLPIKNSLTKSSKTSLPDIYIAGQWSLQPAGVPTAVLTGKQAALNVIKSAKKY
ncbi:MAG: phytoene desaturase family protein [Fervidobacterium sp.]